MSKFWLFCQFCATRIIYIYVFITQTYLKQKQIFFIVRQGTYFTTRKLSIGLRKSASVLNDNLRRNMANHGNPRLTCCVYVCVYECICAYWIYMVLFGDIPNHSTSWSVENLWGADVDTIFSSVYKWDSQWDNRKWLDMDQITDHSPPGWSSGPVHKRLAMANMLVTYAMFWCWPHGCAFQLVYFVNIFVVSGLSELPKMFGMLMQLMQFITSKTYPHTRVATRQGEAPHWFITPLIIVN